MSTTPDDYPEGTLMPTPDDYPPARRRLLIPKAIDDLERAGLFERVRTGDERAAMLFARLAAYTLNPDGHPTMPGALRKTGGGKNIDGYAEDAIVLNADPDDKRNVIDLVVGAGAPGASLTWNGPLPRRVGVDVWEKPKPLTAAELEYLKGTSSRCPDPSAHTQPRCPDPAVHTRPAPRVPGRGEAMQFGRWLDHFYQSRDGLQRAHGLIVSGRPDWEGIGAWMFDVWLQARISGLSETDARQRVISQIEQTDEWQRLHRGGR